MERWVADWLKNRRLCLALKLNSWSDCTGREWQWTRAHFRVQINFNIRLERKVNPETYLKQVISEWVRYLQGRGFPFPRSLSTSALFLLLSSSIAVPFWQRRRCAICNFIASVGTQLVKQHQPHTNRPWIHNKSVKGLKDNDWSELNKRREGGGNDAARRRRRQRRSNEKQIGLWDIEF